MNTSIPNNECVLVKKFEMFQQNFTQDHVILVCGEEAD